MSLSALATLLETFFYTHKHDSIALPLQVQGNKRGQIMMLHTFCSLL